MERKRPRFDGAKIMPIATGRHLTMFNSTYTTLPLTTYFTGQERCNTTVGIKLEIIHTGQETQYLSLIHI